MFSNLNNTVKHIRCENCKNKSICKYKEDFNKIIDKSNTIDIDVSSPISIEVKCSQFTSILVEHNNRPFGWGK